MTKESGNMLQARIKYGVRIELVNQTYVDLNEGEVFDIVASYISDTGRVMVVLHKVFYAPFAIKKDTVELLNVNEEEFSHAIS